MWTVNYGRKAGCYFYQFIGNRSFVSISVVRMVHARRKRKGVTVGFSNHRHVGGSSFHVSDCQIWAEIHYLDSRTDYKEYLAVNSLRGWQPLESELVMLDDEHPHSWSVPSLFSFTFVARVSASLGLVLLLLFEH